MGWLRLSYSLGGVDLQARKGGHERNTSRRVDLLDFTRSKAHNPPVHSFRTCHRHYPGRSGGACSLVHLHHQRPSLCNSQVGSCNYFFGACSAFTHVMACTLAESLNDPFHRKLRQLRCLRCRFDCYRVERTSSRAGVAPAEVQRLFTAHCYAN